ncbi:synaptotagmin-1-like [Macrobrachium rosenbergii]|uniref:synaptotagmin-1-like n=1 Tax=Macrobrachium rosenbergii TaxID=79674 RepID=UPI0034D42ED7
MFILPSWGRWAMIAGGITIVALTALIVICIVVPGCFLNKIFLDDEDERKKRKKDEKGSLIERQVLSGDILGDCNSNFSKDGKDTDSVLTHSTQSTKSVSHSKATEKHSTSSVETSSLLSSLADSNYSSMSEYSGRSSPTVSYQGSVVGNAVSGASSPVCEEQEGHLTFGIQYIANTHDVNIGKLVITVLEGSGFSGKEYLGTSCDAYVKVVVTRERRSLRKQKSPPLSVFRTRTIRHSRCPAFNQSFIMDADKNQLKELVVKLIVMDQDKWASPSTLGEVIQPLKDIKNLASIEHRTILSFSLSEPKIDIGEVLFGLSFLPTAQRLSVSVVKASNLRYQNLVEDLNDFHPFVRVMLISGSGRLIKKKKTGWRSGTTIPVWNETLVFDITQAQMEHMTFILVLCTRHQLPLTPCSSDTPYQSMETLPDLALSSDDADHGPQRNDRYLGKVVLGCNVRKEDSRNHWNAILTCPRKVASQWHPLR